MSWITKLKNLFKKEELAPAAGAVSGMPPGIPALPPEIANDPKMKGAMAAFYRKWKDPAFLKELHILTGHMRRDGVDTKDMKAISDWLEKNEKRIENGDFKEAPQTPGETFIKTGPGIGRNDPCHCGSSKKFKKCHGT